VSSSLLSILLIRVLKVHFLPPPLPLLALVDSFSEISMTSSPLSKLQASLSSTSFS
jgi:hypothetical protein